jgi:hypothetical protein
MYFVWLADRNLSALVSPAHEHSTRITAALAGGVEHHGHQCALQLADRGGSARGVGVLLALPCVIESGAFGSAASSSATFRRKIRIKRLEHPKECDPAALGRLLGLDRAPEVKRLRRQLTRFVAHHCAERLGAELARLRADQRGHLMGFCTLAAICAPVTANALSSNAHVPRRHLAMPASPDYWINDRSGDPLLVMTGEIDAALTKALPGVLREVRQVVGERRAPCLRPRWLEPQAVHHADQGWLRRADLSNLAELGRCRGLQEQPRAARARGFSSAPQRSPAHRGARPQRASRVVKLATERKHLSDIVKMIAYQAESDPLAMLAAHYARPDQQRRTLPHELFGR